MNEIRLIPLQTPLIQQGDSVTEIIIKTLQNLSIELENGDVIIIAETPLAIAEGRMVELAKVNPSKKAEQLASKHEMDPRIVQVIINEADEILGGVKGVLLTNKNSTLIANAGVDFSNAPPGFVVLFPEDLQNAAHLIRIRLEEEFQKRVGVIIGDSRVQPLRRGTIGVALAVDGLNPIEDVRGRQDLYGRELQVTFRAIADDLVSAAQLLMGEADEQIPVVIIRGAPVQLTETQTISLAIPKNECLFMNSFSPKKE
ncbi:MAG: coenzyme F420-0:L-glutamate ligase [Candidatus Helarchaeota archaeon]